MENEDEEVLGISLAIDWKKKEVLSSFLPILHTNNNKEYNNENKKKFDNIMVS